jgi:heme O synthase-like polyprenyltransferase
MGRVIKIFDSTYFWLASKFKDDHTLIGSRQLLLLSLSETLYIIVPILLLIFYTVPDEIREVIKPYGKVVSLVVGFGVLWQNKKRYLAQIENGSQVKIFHSDLLYLLVLFLPLIIIIALFYRPWLPPPQ